MRRALIGLMLLACVPPSPPLALAPPTDAGEADAALELDPGDAGAPAPDSSALDAGLPDRGEPDAGRAPGFIGSPCAEDRDCDLEGGRCLTDGAPMGVCTQACERRCPDREGYPVTFCADAASLPPPFAIGAGACLSRCDYGAYPESGCRPGYGCVVRPRAMEPGTTRAVCVPGETSETSECLRALAAMDVRFSPTVIPDRHPDGHPELTCHVEEPVILHPPIHGVDVRYYDGSPSPNIYGSCEMARALVRTIDDVKARGAVRLYHLGTYVCRAIRGTSRLSRHGMGDAIDIEGFELADGTRYTLEDHWEHDTTAPRGPGARFLYEAAHRWHRAKYWRIILTPNYDAAHDNHFHVDLTPGSDFLRLTDEGFIGPAPYVD